MQHDTIGVLVVRSVRPRAHGQDRVRAHAQGQRVELVSLVDPAWSDDLLTGEQMGPGALGHVEVHLTLGVEHRCDQQRLAQHVLRVDRGRRTVRRELQCHRPHHRSAVAVGLFAHPREVRHEGELQAGELPRDIAARRHP